jgi:hypothetical protein
MKTFRVCGPARGELRTTRAGSDQDSPGRGAWSKADVSLIRGENPPPNHYPHHFGAMVLTSFKTIAAAMRSAAESTNANRLWVGVLALLAQIRLIRELDALLERRLCTPAQSSQTSDVEQFARRAVGP